jgi:hypothetical protein
MTSGPLEAVLSPHPHLSGNLAITGGLQNIAVWNLRQSQQVGLSWYSFLIASRSPPSVQPTRATLTTLWALSFPWQGVKTDQVSPLGRPFLVSNASISLSLLPVCCCLPLPLSQLLYWRSSDLRLHQQIRHCLSSPTLGLSPLLMSRRPHFVDIARLSSLWRMTRAAPSSPLVALTAISSSGTWSPSLVRHLLSLCLSTLT